MSPSTQELFQNALALPPRERTELIDALIAEEDESDPAQLDEAWHAEVRRRSAEVDAGTVVCTPWSEVKRRVRQRLEARKNA